MSLKFKMMRSAAGYHPGQAPAEYEKLAMHHAATVPVYETYERRIYAWDPKQRRITSRTVTKIRYGADGKTPLRPVMQLVTVPGGDPARPEQVHVPSTQLIPIAHPVRLKKGSPKSVYRVLKRIERAVGLDVMFDRLHAEAAKGVV